MMLFFRPKLLVLTCALAATAFGLEGCKALSAMHFPRMHKKKNGGSELCEKYAPYLAARSVPTLRVGEGLSPPNVRNGIKVPEGAAESHAHTVKEGCLDAPPAFDSGAKPKATPPVKSAPHEAPGAE